MHAASDEEILAKALSEDRIVVSADSDFGAILAAQEADRPSFILFRDPNLLVAHDYFNMLLTALPVLGRDLEVGCVAVLRNHRLRVRKLHFRHGSPEAGFQTAIPGEAPVVQSM